MTRRAVYNPFCSLSLFKGVKMYGVLLKIFLSMSCNRTLRNKLAALSRSASRPHKCSWALFAAIALYITILAAQKPKPDGTCIVVGAVPPCTWLIHVG